MILQASIYDVKRRQARATSSLRHACPRDEAASLRGVRRSDSAVWLPDAGPSVQLLADYRAGTPGDAFLARYEHEQMQQPQCRIVRYEDGERVADTVEALSPLAWLRLLEKQHGIITVMCWEPEPHLCHRHRLVELLKARETMQQTLLWEGEQEAAGAVIVGHYRYRLWRVWNAQLPRVLFVLLNPSTATGQVDDPTLRRCVGFATSWGDGALEIVNLFAWRSPDPAALSQAEDPIGSDNNRHIQQAAARAGKMVVAWGAHKAVRGRDREVLALLKDYPLWCLGTTRNGSPRHPLYVKAETPLCPFPVFCSAV